MNNKEKRKGWPLSKRIFAAIIEKTSFREIPENPKKGKWYRLTPKDALCANGDEYHASIRLGRENKLVIMFSGGGVSVSDYTDGRPNDMLNEKAEAFYFNTVDLVADVLQRFGLGNKRKDNPFKDWNFVFIPYASGDFHIGTKDNKVTGRDGKEMIVHHHGYINYRKTMDMVKKYVSNPDKMLVTGFSGGGFAAALLTDDCMSLYPDCKDVTCCMDSSLLLYDDWKGTAEEIWGAPKEICDRLGSNDITFDSVKALHKKYGNRVKYLFTSSIRDAALSAWFMYFIGKGMTINKESGDLYQKALIDMCKYYQEEIPEIGFFLFDIPYPTKNEEEKSLTTHTILLTWKVYTYEVGGYTVAKWLYDAVENNKVEKIGLELLEKHEPAPKTHTNLLELLRSIYCFFFH